MGCEIVIDIKWIKWRCVFIHFNYKICTKGHGEEDIVNSFVCFLLQDAYKHRTISTCLVGTKVMLG